MGLSSPDIMPPKKKDDKKKDSGKKKVMNAVFFDKALYEKCVNEVPKFKLITPSVISERMRVNGSLARRTIKDLMAKGLIRQVSSHSSQCIYTLHEHMIHEQRRFED